jgi:hypothetical protein
MNDTTYCDPDTSTWPVVAPPSSELPEHRRPVQVSAPRCEHGVINRNPRICSACGGWTFAGVKKIEWNPISLSRATVNTISSPTKIVPPAWVKDKPWSGTSGRLTRVVGTPWPFLSQFQPSPIVGEIPPVRFQRAPEDKYILMLDNVATHFGELEHTRSSEPMFGACGGGTKTAGRQLHQAQGRYTRTSLDKDFTKANNPGAEMNTDRDDFGSYEPTQSLTMNPEPETRIETVVLSENGGPARSYVENDIPHHRPEELHLLPADFWDDELGIKDRADAFELLEVLKAIRDFDVLESGEVSAARDARVAKFVRQRYKNRPFVAPKDEGMEEFALPKHREDEVRDKLRNQTPKQLRRKRERLAALGIYGSTNGKS